MANLRTMILISALLGLSGVQGSRYQYYKPQLLRGNSVRSFNRVERFQTDPFCPDHETRCPQKTTCCQMEQVSSIVGDKLAPQHLNLSELISVPVLEEAGVDFSKPLSKTNGAQFRVAVTSLASSYGCCPYEKGVCCSDKIHCCPENFICNLKANSCDKMAAIVGGEYA